MSETTATTEISYVPLPALCREYPGALAMVTRAPNWRPAKIGMRGPGGVYVIAEARTYTEDVWCIARLDVPGGEVLGEYPSRAQAWNTALQLAKVTP